MCFLCLTWNRNCPIANFRLKVFKVLIWGKTLEEIYEVLQANDQKGKKKKVLSKSFLHHRITWNVRAERNSPNLSLITSFSLCLLSEKVFSMCVSVSVCVCICVVCNLYLTGPSQQHP